MNNDTQNYPLLVVETFDTQLNEPTNQNLTKVPKVLKPTNKKCYYKTLGTSVLKSSMSSPSLVNCSRL